MTNEELTYKDLSKKQLDSLKDIYIQTRVNSMNEEDLRSFASEVLELQIRVTVGADEEKEVWKEMKEYFGDSFSVHIKEIIKVDGDVETAIDQAQETFKKRLEVLEQRKLENKDQNEDMW